ncbi:MAG: large conductance mechanosensitive channel protein MscL [Dehalococcoidia bacterium]
MAEFRKFLLRGNVVDLAVAVVIGAAFGAVVTAMVEDLVTPFIGAFGGQPDFSAWVFTVNGSEFKIGHFLNAVISFVILAAVIFFFVVKPVNMLMARARNAPPVDPTTKKCDQCLSEIPLMAKRCAFCAQPV